MTKVMFVIGIFVSVSLADGYFNLEVGSSCENYGTPGVCKTVKNCPFALNNLRRYRDHNLTRCGFRKFDEIVCCPDTVEKNPGQSIPVHETTRKRYERVCEEIINRTKFVIRPFVIGGEDSLQNEFPHMAALGYNNSDSGELDWRCAASIISDRFLLTAAHCVAGPEPARARIGVTRLNDTDGLDIDIGKIISHPSWDGLDRFDDIALVQLARKLDFNERIRPACLYTANDDPDELIVTGWGKTTASGESTAPVLQKAKLRPVPIEKCTARYIEASLGTRRVISKQICTTAFSDGSLADACGGDSGGPVQSMHRYGAYKIVGIVSYGANCGSGSIPSVNTRISSYLDWIEDNVMLFSVFVVNSNEMNCPVCNSTLALKQINFNEAIYLCENMSCSYPAKHKCIVVRRTLKEMQKDMLNKRKNERTSFPSHLLLDNSSQLAQSLASANNLPAKNCSNESPNEGESTPTDLDIPSLDALIETDFDSINLLDYDDLLNSLNNL